ncbi:chlorophyll synthase ChlG [Prosthecomicrobium sp. N25]|uniref:chlorophyll synthase ChlG n=1 Tax=Prosthecomicrobium sp. N25 TaxID=3129254 RepID=UPI003078A0FD
MRYPAPHAVLELLKPITWFAPMWAFGCGVAASGRPLSEGWAQAGLGILLAGPLVCATSQAVNDWYDRHVDAINEPGRPIPSGRIPGRWGFVIACLWTLLSLAVAWTLGPIVVGATAFGLALAWAYSAPPLRLKQNGWWGNAAVALCYEGLPWITGVVVMSAVLPDWRVIATAALYSLGAHGIMTLNDFKSVEGDTRMGIRSLPVQLGVDGAARLASWVMGLPQVAVILILAGAGRPWHAVAILGLLAVQVRLMQVMMRDPKGKAAWYNATGTTLYVLGMLVAAFALRPV